MGADLTIDSSVIESIANSMTRAAAGLHFGTALTSAAEDAFCCPEVVSALDLSSTQRRDRATLTGAAASALAKSASDSAAEMLAADARLAAAAG